jgi:hypothetical protein
LHLACHFSPNNIGCLESHGERDPEDMSQLDEKEHKDFTITHGRRKWHFTPSIILLIICNFKTFRRGLGSVRGY